MPRQDRPSSSTYAADEMVAANPLAARRRKNASSLSVAVPSSCDELVVRGAITNRFAISSPHLNLRGDQTAIDEPPNLKTTATLDHPRRILQVRYRPNLPINARTADADATLPTADTLGQGLAYVLTSPAKVGFWDRTSASACFRDNDRCLQRGLDRPLGPEEPLTMCRAAAIHSCVAPLNRRASVAGLYYETMSRVRCLSTGALAMANASSLIALMKFLGRDEWREAFADLITPTSPHSATIA